MRKKIWITGIVAIFVMFIIAMLSIYLSDSNTEQKQVKKEKDNTIEEVEDFGSKHLKNVGEKVKQKGWGIFTLRNRVIVKKNFDFENVRISIEDIKLIELTDIPPSRREMLKTYTGLSFNEAYAIYYQDDVGMEEIEERAALTRKEIGNKVTFYEMNYTVKNISSRELQFYSFLDTTFNEDDSFYVPEKNFIISSDTIMGTKSVSRIDYKPNEIRRGVIGLLNDSKKSSNDLKTLTFTTDNIRDGETHKLIEKQKTFHIELDK